MSAADQAFITGRVVAWARERARVTRDRLATRLGTEIESVVSWERGTSNPTIHQAHRLADILHVPFGYLFLPAPPKEVVPLPDFRMVKGAETTRPSADLIDLINDVIFKQQWYREFLVSQGRGETLPFVGRFSITDDSEIVAEDLRRTLGITSDLRLNCRTWDDFFRSLIRKSEHAGILVMRSGIAAGNTRRPVSAKDFRGFAISDPVAPLVFVNSKDWKAAQIFTLAHELVHIWINASGISNVDLDLKQPIRNDVERFCNKTAAEVLVPRVEFLPSWTDSGSIDDNVEAIARRFKVSRLVALRKALDLDRISWKEYADRYKQAEQTFRGDEEHQRTAGGHAYRNILARNSETLTTTVVRGAVAGGVLYRDAARLLNVSVPTIQKINKYIKKRKEGT
jgi:Zn-dependent peptidase ImmA (M78 family)/DNA-binding XRE family transcriptional regulator